MLATTDLGALASWTVAPVPTVDGWPDGYPDGVGSPPTLPVSVPATVPGGVHTDLIAAGLIADPRLGLGEPAAQWIGYTDWRWTATFEATAAAPGEWVVLRLDGVDTVAQVRLGGELVASVRNLHRSYRIDVTGQLRDGPNTLTVDVRSAARYAQQAEQAYGYLPQDYEHPYNFVRKTASSFGWDWGPTLVTAGLWRPVWLERGRGVRATGLRWRTSVPPPDTWTGPCPHGILHVAVDLDWTDGAAAVDVVASVAGRTGRVRVPVGTAVAALAVEVPAPALWWPAGHGAAERYDVRVAVHAPATGALLAERTGAAGFRHVALDSRADDLGRAFTLRINGEPLFVKGANWIPDDSFPTLVDAERYGRRLDQAAAANLNLIRVWGGGHYEDEAFYRACDARGLLVWQDFMFACAAYPQDDAFRAEVEAEAREAVVRIGAHPCVAVFNGSNENELGAADWRWDQRAPHLPWGRVYDEEILPRIVAELAPDVPFVPSSPTSLDPAVYPNEPDHGCTHLWDVWNALDWRHYRDSVPRFAAEYGFQGPPSRHLLTTAVGDPTDPREEAMLAHQKQAGGAEKLDRNLRGHFPPPANFADWHLATSLNQAYALRTAVEHLRSWWPRCAGSIIWQLNDCWPVTSWSLIDYAEVPKPAWYAVRDAYAPRLVTVQPRERGLVAALVNDTDDRWQTVLRLARRDLDGTVRAEARMTVKVAARAVTTVGVPVPVRAPHRPRREVLTAEADGLRAVHRFVPDDALPLPPGRRTARVETGPGGYRVAVQADEFVADLLLLADLAHPRARADSALVTLFPGERHVFTVTCPPLPDPGILLAPHVLRCANEVTRVNA